MLKSILAAAAFATGIAVAIADDPPPAPRVAPKAAQPGFGTQPGFTNRATPAMLARYEEEAEVLEAQLDVKKAYIKAAEVGFTGAKLKLERVIKLESSKAVPPEEVLQAKLEAEAAAAQLDIRKAEAKEVDVRLKHAKKRLEDGKAAGVRPAPRAPIDPR